MRFLFIALLVASSIHAQDGQYQLRLHWEPGKVFRQETTTETTSRHAGSGKASQSMKVVQTTDMAVTEDSTGNRLVNVRFASVKGEVSADGKKMKFDSNKSAEDNPMLQQAFGRSIGKSFTLIYDSQDRYRDVSNITSLASEPGAATGLAAVAESRDVANLFRRSLEMGLPPLPVGVGDSWVADEAITFPAAGEVRVQMTGKLQAIEKREGRKHAKIAFEGKFGSAPSQADKPMSLVHLSNDSSIAGILFFDLERRIISFGAYTTSIKLEAPGEIIPFEQKVTSRMSVNDAAKDR